MITPIKVICTVKQVLDNLIRKLEYRHKEGGFTGVEEDLSYVDKMSSEDLSLLNQSRSALGIGIIVRSDEFIVRKYKEDDMQEFRVAIIKFETETLERMFEHIFQKKIENNDPFFEEEKFQKVCSELNYRRLSLKLKND